MAWEWLTNHQLFSRFYFAIAMIYKERNLRMKRQSTPEEHTAEKLTDIAESLSTIAGCLEEISATLERLTSPVTMMKEGKD